MPGVHKKVIYASTNRQLKADGLCKYVLLFSKHQAVLRGVIKKICKHVIFQSMSTSIWIFFN